MNISPENVNARIERLSDVSSILEAGMRAGLVIKALSLKSVQFAALPMDQIVALHPPQPPLGPSSPVAPPVSPGSLTGAVNDATGNASSAVVSSVDPESNMNSTADSGPSSSAASNATTAAAGADGAAGTVNATASSGSGAGAAGPSALNNTSVVGALGNDEKHPLLLVPAPIASSSVGGALLNCTGDGRNCTLGAGNATSSNSSSTTTSGAQAAAAGSSSSPSSAAVTTASSPPPSVLGGDPSTNSRFPGMLDSVLSAAGATVAVTTAGPILGADVVVPGALPTVNATITSSVVGSMPAAGSNSTQREMAEAVVAAGAEGSAAAAADASAAPSAVEPAAAGGGGARRFGRRRAF